MAALVCRFVPATGTLPNPEPDRLAYRLPCNSTVDFHLVQDSPFSSARTALCVNLKKYKEGIEACEEVQGRRTAGGEWSWSVYFSDPGAFQLLLRVWNEDLREWKNGPMNYIVVDPILRLGAEQVAIDVLIT